MIPCVRANWGDLGEEGAFWETILFCVKRHLLAQVHLANLGLTVSAALSNLCTFSLFPTHLSPREAECHRLTPISIDVKEHVPGTVVSGFTHSAGQSLPRGPDCFSH